MGMFFTRSAARSRTRRKVSHLTLLSDASPAARHPMKSSSSSLVGDAAAVRQHRSGDNLRF
jgi:hypothetical protein